MVGLSSLDRKLLRDLWALKGQILAIAIVIASGVSTFVAMLSTMDSLREAMDGYYARYRFAEVFAGAKRVPEHIRHEIAAIEGRGCGRDAVVADVTLDVRGTVEAVTGRLVSIPDHEDPRLNGIYLRRGRMPEPTRDDEVVVSEVFALAHGLETGDRVRAIINERRKELRIVGIGLSPEYAYAIKPGAIIPDKRLFGIFWMRRRPLATAFDMHGAFNDVTLTLTRTARPDAVVAAVDGRLERYGGLGAITRKDQPSHWFLQNEFTQLRSTGAILPLVFLGVAAFLLNVVVSRLVGKQRDQIAVLKAFGYTNLQVGLHFVKLVLVIVLLAACARLRWRRLDGPRAHGDVCHALQLPVAHLPGRAPVPVPGAPHRFRRRRCSDC